MGDIDVIRQAGELRAMVQTSPGFKHLEREIDERIRLGWEKFIELSPEKKTSKTAYHYQAQYKVLKDLKDWISDTIRTGENTEKMQRRTQPQPVRAGY